MSFVIAAAGTGGHVFPGLAVGQALLAEGVPTSEILYVGGARLEAQVYPREGFDFLAVELRGLKRSLSVENLRIPGVVFRARDRIREAMRTRKAAVALGMGGYVTVPTGLAARRESVSMMVAEQNAGAGLANRVVSRWAARTFVSFPSTHGLRDGEWVGNPIRPELATYDRGALRGEALDRYELLSEIPVLGVFGGSLGAGAVNSAVASMLAEWSGDPIQVVHLTGQGHVEALSRSPMAPGVTWRRIGFEARMDLFFAAVDLVVARGGGAVAEITATMTPAILVPGEFGSSGHQGANAAFLASAGSAVVITESHLADLGEEVESLLADEGRRAAMSAAAQTIAKPDAARTIARAMIEAAA